MSTRGGIAGWVRALVAAMALALAACPAAQIINQAPVAFAGYDRSAVLGDMVILDGGQSYDPDGKYFGDKSVTDSCAYSGGNWATEWQNSHTLGVDWYQCSSAHSEPLNANLKAYAAWWLWARLAGWNGGA